MCPCGKVPFPGFGHLQGEAFDGRGYEQEKRIDQKKRDQPDNNGFDLYVFFQLLDFHIDQMFRNQTDKGNAGNLTGCACHDIIVISRTQNIFLVFQSFGNI